MASRTLSRARAVRNQTNSSNKSPRLARLEETHSTEPTPVAEPEPTPVLPDWARHQIERIQARAAQEQEHLTRTAEVAAAERAALTRTGHAGDQATVADLIVTIWGEGDELPYDALEDAADMARALCFVDDAELVRRLLDRVATRSRLAVDFSRRIARAERADGTSPK